MATQEVILVNEADEAVGTMDKMEAHRKALLHRAFSVFIFNGRGHMLLQQRADTKYHSPGLWTNACCSHPFPGEEVSEAASRRLQEELGFTTGLEKIFTFTYRAPFDNGLTEYEFDHVFAGIYDGEIVPDAEEVKAVNFMQVDDIAASLHAAPEAFTAWFRIAFPGIRGWVDRKFGMPVVEI